MHLSNIMHNLIDNAIKYSNDPPQLKINGELLTNNKLELSVTDAGPGIPVDQREKVFEKFYRIPTGNVHDVKGFGLGLYYVHSICKAHGWQIVIKDAPEGPAGARVSITVPLEKSANP